MATHIPRALFVLIPIIDTSFSLVFIMLRPTGFELPLRLVDWVSVITIFSAILCVILANTSTPPVALQTAALLYQLLQSYRLHTFLMALSDKADAVRNRLNHLWLLSAGAIATSTLTICYSLKVLPFYIPQCTMLCFSVDPSSPMLYLSVLSNRDHCSWRFWRLILVLSIFALISLYCPIDILLCNDGEDWKRFRDVLAVSTAVGIASVLLTKLLALRTLPNTWTPHLDEHTFSHSPTIDSYTANVGEEAGVKELLTQAPARSDATQIALSSSDDPTSSDRETVDSYASNPGWEVTVKEYP